MLFQSWTTHRSVSAWGGEHALNKLLSVCWCLHMQRQIDAERKRQQVKKVASAKLEKLLTKKAEVRHLLLILLPSPSSPHTLPLLHPPPFTLLHPLPLSHSYSCNETRMNWRVQCARFSRVCLFTDTVMSVLRYEHSVLLNWDHG